MQRLIKKSGLYPFNCDYMVGYIDGEFYEGKTPYDLKQQHENKAGKFDFVQYAEMFVLNKKKPEIYVSTKNMQGTTIDKLTPLIKSKYPNALIYDNDQYEDVNYQTRPKKIAKQENKE